MSLTVDDNKQVLSRHKTTQKDGQYCLARTSPVCITIQHAPLEVQEFEVVNEEDFDPTQRVLCHSLGDYSHSLWDLSTGEKVSRPTSISSSLLTGTAHLQLVGSYEDEEAAAGSQLMALSHIDGLVVIERRTKKTTTPSNNNNSTNSNSNYSAQNDGWERKELAALRGHQREVDIILQLRDGSIVTGSRDHTLKRWKLPQGTREWTPPSNKKANLGGTAANYRRSERSIGDDVLIIECLQTFVGHDSVVTAVVRLENNNYVSLVS